MPDLSSPGVDAAGLFLLSRRLMQIAESVLPQQNAATSLRFVALDVAYHPDSSISEITERTGLPQSLVSMSVAKLRNVGVLETEPDPADRRRTLVRTTATMEGRARRVGGTSIETALAEALAVDDHEEAADALAALDLLARLLVPEILEGDTEPTPAARATPARPSSKSTSSRR
jgi:DNA-binding MarR family transcriptional regulator